MQHRSDLRAEMQIINPLGQGALASHRRSWVWRSRRGNLFARRFAPARKVDERMLLKPETTPAPRAGRKIARKR
jgi:hypothetical protein